VALYYSVGRRHRHHSYGGGGAAPRSKGILHADIDAKNYPDADIILSGHNHQKLVLPIVCYKRSYRGKITHHTRYWVKTGNYKRNDRLPLIGGWHVEKKFDPTPLGGYFLTIEAKRNRSGDDRPTVLVEADIKDAK